jgi:hypothetical protein
VNNEMENKNCEWIILGERETHTNEIRSHSIGFNGGAAESVIFYLNVLFGEFCGLILSNMYCVYEQMYLITIEFYFTYDFTYIKMYLYIEKIGEIAKKRRKNHKIKGILPREKEIL